MKSERRGKFGERKEKALIFVVLFVAMAFVSIGCASAATIYVPDSHTKIQWAVNNATAGDTIIVRDGTYTENINVNKCLTIRSENGSDLTIVQAKNSSKHVFKVSVDYVNITGFHVKNANGDKKAGILLKNVNYCNISNNKASNNDVGIRLYESCDNLIMDNIANNNTRPGIGLKSSSNYNNITGNTAKNNGWAGIGLNTSSRNNTIIGNTAYSNKRAGIGLNISSNNNTIIGNTAYNNKRAGIGLNISSNNNIITGNTATNNGRCGIGLENSSENNIISSNNASSNNAHGIYLGFSSNNTITNNTANENNHSGIHLLWESRNNTVTNNTVNSNNYSGIYLKSSSYNTLTKNTVNSNIRSGIYLSSSSYNTLTKNTCLNNRHGINLRDSNNYNMLMSNTANLNDRHGICPRNSSNNTLTSNTANSNGYKGINLRDSNNNLIYNNHFNNTNNAFDDGNNIWNIAKTTGTNIIGGPYLGGNYWSDYAGEDLDGDGLGDTLLPYNFSGGIQNGGDYLPLVIPQAVISGRVCEADGVTPITGATVEAIPVEEGEWREAKTASDGTYTITGLLPTGKYKVRAFKSGYAREYYDNVFPSHEATIISITAPNEIAGINFNLTEGSSISGHIYQSDGITPIGGARVFVRPSKYGFDDGFYATTSSTGCYLVDCLSLGNYRVTAEAQGYAKLKYYDGVYGWVSATDVKVTPPDSTPDIDINLDRGGSISGFVYASDGVTPIPDLCLIADTTTWNFEGIGAGSREDGSYTISGLPPGKYTVRTGEDMPNWYAGEFYDSKYTWGTADKVTVTAGGDTSNINFTLDEGGSITGHVFDEETGEPISEIQLSASLPDGDGTTPAPLTTYGGSYKFVLRPGSYLIKAGVGFAQAHGYKYVPEWYNNSYDRENATLVNVTIHNETPGIDIYLSKAGSISGYVYSEDRYPIGDANVYAFSDIYPGSGANTESDGSYIIEGLPSGNYMVQVTVSGYGSESYKGVVVKAPYNTPGINFTLKEVPELTISIYTDKYEYTPGDTMLLSLDVTNPGDAQAVSVKIGIEKPDGSTVWFIKKPYVTLPAGLEFGKYTLITLPSIPAGTYMWHAKLSDPFTGEIISEDTAEWAFVSTRTPTEEITEVLEQTTVEIDFEEKT